MPENDWKPVAAALLFGWPSQVNSWGDVVLAGYCSKLADRGVTPDEALAAIDSCGPEQKFPPSVPELAGMARHDPAEPTFAELVQALYGSGGVIRPLWAWPGERGMPAAAERLAEQHELVQAFARSVGSEWLRNVDPRDGEHEFAGADRRKLDAAWREFLGRHDEREVAQLTGARRRGSLRRGTFDALQIGGGS